MDFLKSAVASAMAQGPPFPYSFGDKVDADASIWTLYNGTRRADGSACSIFAFDSTAPGNAARLPLARNALRKLRTMRHPGVVRVLDAVETETYIYLATERVTPLRWHVRRRECALSPETAKWGLHGVARTLRFLNEEAASVHAALRVAAVYADAGGEWKLAGFELLSCVRDDHPFLYAGHGELLPDAARYAPPEVARGGWEATKKNPHAAVDAYNFGTMIFEVFNGDFTGPEQAGQTKGIPPSMHAGYKRLVNPNPRARITVGAFLEQGRRSGSYFDSPLIKLTDGIDNLGVKTEEERERFLDDLDEVSDDFPEDFFKMKVLPELLKSVEFGGGGPKALGVVMKISTKLTSDDFEARVQPVVLRLFANPDRAIRVSLLDNLPLMIDRLPNKVVNDKIFPNVVSGFTDVAPVVREQTLKSVLVIIGKLSDRTINGELLKYLAKTANDEQPGIRTNTTICLGKIARHLGTSNRAKVLLAAFTRSLRDPFVHARNAALMALAATVDHFGDEDCAARVLPAVCPSLIDKEKLVRDQANKTMDVYLARIRKAAAGMPESALPPPQAVDAAAAGPRMGTPQPGGEALGASSTAGSWAGWAISSFTNKLSAASGDMQTGGAAAATPPVTAAPSMGGLDPKRTNTITTTTSSASALHRQAVSPAPASAPLSSAGAADSYFKSEPAAFDNEEDDGGDAWGDMGDMDDMPDEDGDAAAAYFDAPAPKHKKDVVVPVPGGDDDGGEPDFAGWLAAQAQKKKNAAGGGNKALPKGLAKKKNEGAKKKTTTTTTTASANKPAKKIDLKPKAAADDDDDDGGWGDGW
ncbi:ARM repeat-containing protein [Xylariomycetidae sp. FL0641]|nr:ARM repeat-containing protein [Xylariomycetidae sp. FL0641]